MKSKKNKGTKDVAFSFRGGDDITIRIKNSSLVFILNALENHDCGAIQVTPYDFEKGLRPITYISKSNLIYMQVFNN